MPEKKKDSTISLVVHGNTPSKKNQRISIRTKQGRMLNIPSNKYREWHKVAEDDLYGQKTPHSEVLPLEVVSSTTLTFFSPNKRKYDLSNKSESIMDLLVDCGFLEDDNWAVVHKLEIVHGGVDRENPRCEIILKR